MEKPVEIDYNEHVNNFKAKVEELLDKLIAKEITGISIKNVISENFCKMFEVEEVIDFNGWQCDWWSKMKYKEVTIEVGGCAWYGTIGLGLED